MTSPPGCCGCRCGPGSASVTWTVRSRRSPAQLVREQAQLAPDPYPDLPAGPGGARMARDEAGPQHELAALDAAPMRGLALPGDGPAVARQPFVHVREAPTGGDELGVQVVVGDAPEPLGIAAHAEHSLAPHRRGECRHGAGLRELREGVERVRGRV